MGHFLGVAASIGLGGCYAIRGSCSETVRSGLHGHSALSRAGSRVHGELSNP
jgi:hypothetical protein